MAFEGYLFGACKKSNWVVHAFVVMSNHCDLAVETRRALAGRSETGRTASYPNNASNFFASSGVSTPTLGSDVTSIAME